ncbi:MAG: LamG-like jellyroll fold domain-containing protein [Planctomycetota bacterium]
MCKKLVVLTSFVLVVVISGVASANLVVPADTTTTRDSDLTDTGYVGVAGHLIVNSGNIQFGSQSWINGPNNVGTGGTRPEITVNGGNLDINARLDMGTGSDAYLTMNSGYFRVGGDLKLPDNAGGTHRIWLNGGTLRVHALQLVSNRDAQIIVGGGVLELEDLPSTSTGSYDPTDWLTAINPAIGEPALVPAEGFVQVVIDYDVPVAGGATVSAIASGLYAGNPNPAEAATGVCPDGAVLSWKPADLMVDPNHDVYLDPNRDDVAQATRASHANVQYYSEDQDSNEYSVPASLQLNTTYHWRVDEVDNGDPCISPIIWSFTTEDGNAFGEMPTNGLRGWSPNSPLITWTPSCMATSQNLYLSTDFNDVNNMVSPIALGAAADSYAPALEAFTTYYWRVETVGGGDGEVWTFKTGYGGLLMQYSFEGSLGADITNPVVDDTGKITFTRYEGGGTLKYGQGRFGGTSALFDSNVGLYRPDPNGPNESDYLRLDGYQYSIHFWVKPTYLSGLDMPDQRLIGKRPGPWGIWINDPGIGEGRDNHFRFVHVGPGSDNVDTADNTAREDEWVHLAAVYNQPDYDVYLNGIWAAGMSRPPLPSDNNNPIGS